MPAERPNVLIRQVEETPIVTPATPTLEPCIMGDLRQVVIKGDTGSTYDSSSGASVSYPFIESLATPIRRYVDDRVFGKHETEQVYTEWDLLPEMREMVDDMLEASDPIASLARADLIASGSSPAITLSSNPVVRDTVSVHGTQTIGFTVGGTLAIGNVLTITIDGTPFSFTMVDTLIASAVAGLVAAMAAASGVTATDSNPEVTVTADDASVPFTYSSSIVSVAGTITESDDTTYFAETDTFTVDYDTGTVTLTGAAATFLSSNDVGIDFTPRPLSSIVAYLLFEDTFSTVKKSPLTFRVPQNFYFATSSVVTLIEGVDLPTGSNISILAEAFEYTLDSPVALNNTDLISGSVVVKNASGKVYVEDTDYVVDLVAGTINVLTSGEIDDDGVTVVFVDYDAKFPGDPKILLSYMASRVSKDGTLLELSERSDLEAIAGEITGWYNKIGPWTPLLFGMSVAQTAAGGNIVAGIATRSDNLSDVLDELTKHELYSLVPMFPDVSLISTIKGHVDTESLPENGHERVLYFSTETRESLPVYPDNLDDAAGVAFLDAANDVLIDWGYDTGDENGDLNPTDPKGGDFVEILGKRIPVVSATLNGTQMTYHLNGAATAFPTSEPSASIPTAPVSPTPPAPYASATHLVYYRVVRDLQRTEMVDLADDVREAFEDRRQALMLPDIVEYNYDIDFTEEADAEAFDLPGFVRSAHVAGLRTVILANQGLTNFTLTGFTGLRHSNKFFTRSEIDLLIANGIDLAVVDGLAVRSLRQLNTDASTLTRAEQSITTTVDFGTKTLRDVLKGFIGVYNRTPRFHEILRLMVQGVEKALQNLTSDRTGSVVQRIDIVEIKDSEIFKDRVEMTLRFVVFSPVNVIDVTILF